MKGTRYIDGILVTQEQLSNTEGYKTEAIKERFGTISTYGIVRTDNITNPLSITTATSTTATISPGEAYTDFNRTDPSPEYASYGERVYVKEPLNLTLKSTGGNRHLFACYLEIHKNRKLDESNVAFYTEKKDSFVIAQLSDNELNSISTAVFVTDCYIDTSKQTDLTTLTVDELNDTFLNSANYIKVSNILNRVSITVTSSNSIYLGTIAANGTVSNSTGTTTRPTFLLDSNVLDLPGGLPAYRMLTVDSGGKLTAHSDTLVNSTNMSLLVDGATTTLHKHNLAYGAQDVTATYSELNRLSGISANVTAVNLSTLTNSTTTTTLHKHNLAQGAADVTATASKLNVLDTTFATNKIVYYDGNKLMSANGGNATDANLTTLTGGGDASTLHSHAAQSSVANAVNVTTNINGNLITTIFEGNGTTVKNATNAGNATTAGSVTNGVYTTGNQSINGTKTFTDKIIGVTTQNFRLLATPKLVMSASIVSGPVPQSTLVSLSSNDFYGDTPSFLLLESKGSITGVADLRYWYAYINSNTLDNLIAGVSSDDTDQSGLQDSYLMCHALIPYASTFTIYLNTKVDCSTGSFKVWIKGYQA